MMNDDKLFLWYGWPTKGVLALFPTGNIVRDPHHREFPTRREQDPNPSSGLVEWSCAVLITTTPRINMDTIMDTNMDTIMVISVAHG